MPRRTGPNLRWRRRIAVTTTAAAIGSFVFLAQRESARLGDAAVLTGATVLAGSILLCLLGVRRRLTFWPLGSVSTWTQIHLYVGLFTTAMYVAHVPQLIAGGVFEFVLSLLFLCVSGSGLYGIYASRTLPKKLTAVEGQHRFDRIAWTRRDIAAASQRACLQIEEPSARQILEAFYRETLEPFFSAQPSVAYILAPSGQRRRRLLRDLRDLDRYLETSGRKVAGQLAALVRHRDDLDYQFALQLRLRVWVVMHSTLSLLLLVASLVHVLLVVRFSG